MAKNKQPKTLEEFKVMREVIVELMGNPYCNEYMFRSLTDKLVNVNSKIEELTTTPKR